MNLKTKLGKRIQELRVKSDLKQSDLAEMVGIATKTQSCIETGKNFPSSNLIERYASALKVDVSEILQIEHIKTSEEIIFEINSLLKCAKENDITLIYKIIKSILK